MGIVRINIYKTGFGRGGECRKKYPNEKYGYDGESYNTAKQNVSYVLSVHNYFFAKVSFLFGCFHNVGMKIIGRSQNKYVDAIWKRCFGGGWTRKNKS